MKISPLDILFIGILIYIVLGWLRRRNSGNHIDRNQGNSTPEAPKRQASDAYERAQRTWDMLRTKENTEGDAPEVQDVDYVPDQDSPPPK